MADGIDSPGFSPDIPRYVSEIPFADPAEVRQSLAPSVELLIEPGRVLSWEEFRTTAPPNSIAIDGYVEGPIQRDLYRKVINLNHHERVDRSSTFATCQQAQFEMIRGLDDFISEGGEFEAKIFANDCDEDVCTSVFLLRHPEFTAKVDNPALNRLVNMEGIMDITSGFFPWPDDYPSLSEFFWVYEPYHEFRNTGGLVRQNPDEYRQVIDEVGQRIEQHITGQGSSIELDTRYDVLEEKGIWKMVRETGKHAKAGMLSDGIKAYTSFTDLGNGRYKYSAGRLSPYIDFDVEGFFEYMNELEGLTGEEKWGGGDTTGGSPRINGSGIPPERMADIIAQFIGNGAGEKEPSTGKEIERKYLITELPEGLDLSAYPSSKIDQGYLANGPDGADRIRRKGNRYFWTFKKPPGEHADERVELECEITKDQFNTMWPGTEGRRLEKTRYEIPFGRFMIELDVFGGDNAGRILAEVEFKTTDEADAFEPPAWFGAYVSPDKRYGNAAIAQDGFPG